MQFYLHLYLPIYTHIHTNTYIVACLYCYKLYIKCQFYSIVFALWVVIITTRLVLLPSFLSWHRLIKYTSWPMKANAAISCFWKYPLFKKQILATDYLLWWHHEKLPHIQYSQQVCEAPYQLSFLRSNEIRYCIRLWTSPFKRSLFNIFLFLTLILWYWVKIHLNTFYR